MADPKTKKGNAEVIRDKKVSNVFFSGFVSSATAVDETADNLDFEEPNRLRKETNLDRNNRSSCSVVGFWSKRDGWAFRLYICFAGRIRFVGDLDWVGIAAGP